MTRSMPKTLKFLKQNMSSVSFDFVNKVGLNSRPNGNAMLLGTFFGLELLIVLLLGTRTYDLHKSPFGPIVQMERDLCDVSINMENYIGWNFKNKGYKTLMAEDWAMGVFNYFNCIGFREQPPADHYMRPFQLRMEEGGWYQWMVDHVFNPKCLENHNVLMDYTEKFIDAYSNTSKFGLTWMSVIAHDDSNGLYRTDDYFLDFFKRYEKKVGNEHNFTLSVVFLQMYNVFSWTMLMFSLWEIMVGVMDL